MRGGVSSGHGGGQKQAAPHKAERRKVRRRLWEIPRGFHCAVLGTCLSLDAVRRILRKAKVPGLEGATEYQVHCVAVDYARQSEVVSKLLDKALARAHAKSWSVYRRLSSSEEVAAQWRRDVDGGDITGAFWAVMHHPAAGAELISESFGVVHMLSHQVGGGSRARLRRSEQLETEVAELRAQLKAVDVAHREALKKVQVELTERDAQLRAQRDEAARWRSRAEAGDPDRVAALEDERSHRIRFVAKLERQLAHTQGVVARLEAAVDDAAAENAELRSVLASIPCLDAGEELAAAPAVLDARMRDVCAKCDLLGCTVLYVGGEKRLVPRLKQLAHAANGRLLHHDGGIEDSIRTLPQLCARADVILCPMSKVGHMAVDHIKRTCSENRKRFIPLRRASLQAFSAGLSRAANAPQRAAESVTQH